MSEHNPSAREEARSRLSEPEGDHELHSVLERMRLDHPHLWEVLHSVHLSHNADPSKLDEWRRAPEGSSENSLAENYDRALGFLAIALQ